MIQEIKITYLDNTTEQFDGVVVNREIGDTCTRIHLCKNGKSTGELLTVYDKSIKKITTRNKEQCSVKFI